MPQQLYRAPRHLAMRVPPCRGPESAELGVAVQAGEHLVATAPSLCAWAPTGGPTLGGDKVVLDIKTVQAFNLGKTQIKGATKTPVSGIGNGAYYITAGALGTSLSVRKGDGASTSTYTAISQLTRSRLRKSPSP